MRRDVALVIEAGPALRCSGGGRRRRSESLGAMPLERGVAGVPRQVAPAGFVYHSAGGKPHKIGPPCALHDNGDLAKGEPHEDASSLRPPHHRALATEDETSAFRRRMQMEALSW